MKIGRVLIVLMSMGVTFGVLAALVAARASEEPARTLSAQATATRTSAATAITPTATLTGTVGSRPKVVVETSPYGDIGTGNIEVTLLDPNVTPRGMEAIAFQVLARAAGTTTDGAEIGAVQFIIFDSKAALDDYAANRSLARAVYQHTERRVPYCLFREEGDDCKALNFARESSWPASDDPSIPRRAIQTGRTHYLVIQVTSSDNPGFNGFWEGVAEFMPIRGSGASVAQGCRQGQVQIRSPRSGSRLSGIVSIRGSATCDHFDYYKFEFEDARCDKGICFVAGPFRPGVVNGELMSWDTRTVPNGQYVLRVVVVGQNGAIFRQIARIRVNIAN